MSRIINRFPRLLTASVWKVTIIRYVKMCVVHISNSLGWSPPLMLFWPWQLESQWWRPAETPWLTRKAFEITKGEYHIYIYFIYLIWMLIGLCPATGWSIGLLCLELHTWPTTSTPCTWHTTIPRRSKVNPGHPRAILSGLWRLSLWRSGYWCFITWCWFSSACPLPW